MFKMLSWYSVVDSTTLKLPRIRVTPYNYTLDNVGVYIKNWYDIRQDWQATGSMSRKLLDDLKENREFILHKMIHSLKSTDQLAKRLADWAMIEAKVHPDRIAEWTVIINTKAGEDALSLDLDELQDLDDHMRRHLYGEGKTGTEFSAKLLEHLDKLVKIRLGGRLALLGGELSSPSESFQIKFDKMESGEEIAGEIEQLEQRLAASNSPSIEPHKENYPNRLSDYIRARAAWVLAADLRADLEYAQSKEKVY